MEKGHYVSKSQQTPHQDVGHRLCSAISYNRSDICSSELWVNAINLSGNLLRRGCVATFIKDYVNSIDRVTKALNCRRKIMEPVQTLRQRRTN